MLAINNAPAWVVGIIFCLVAMPFVGFGLVFAFRGLRMRGSAEGEVVRLRTETDADGDRDCFALVRFRLPDGREIEAETTMTVDPDLAPGARIPIRYVPRNPARMDVAGAAGRSAKVVFALAAVPLVIGLGLIAVSLSA